MTNIKVIKSVVAFFIIINTSYVFGQYDELSYYPDLTRNRIESSNIKNESYFYFVHSYHAVPANNANVLAETQYANSNVPAIVGKENLIGTQFHPEKSGQAGLQLYKNFLDLAYEQKSICA